MNTSTPRRRRWYQFSLRTMFVVVTLISFPLAWVGYSINWIRQRRAALENAEMVSGAWPPSVPSATGGIGVEPQAPWCLRLFGEDSHEEIYCSSKDAELATSLFPEAEIFVFKE